MKKSIYRTTLLLAGGMMLSAGCAAQATTLTVFAAGTLAVPFTKVDHAFEKAHPGITVHAQFGGSVKMARKISDLHQSADILAVADYSVIPKYMFGKNGKPGYTDWYAGIARNAITFVYTKQSKYANRVNARNWYKLLAKPGVAIGRSNPNTDPSGYQTVQMLNLANRYYHDPNIEKRVLANSPSRNMRDTETDLISALQIGQIDYLAIYRSDAIQHHFQYLHLPPQLNLSDPRYSSDYAKGVAHTKSGMIHGRPIVYAMTILKHSQHPEAAQMYTAFVLGPKGRAILKNSGFATFAKPVAFNVHRMPKALRHLVRPWPGERH